MVLKPLLSLHFLNPFTEVNGNENTSVLAMCYYHCRQLYRLCENEKESLKYPDRYT